MKKRLVIWAMLLLTGLSNSFANDGGTINDKVTTSFNKEFADAQDVQWETGKDFYKATFTLHNQVMFAFYSGQGSLLALSRNISTSQLPINLYASVKKNYENYWVSELFEVAMNNETTYYITVENGDQKVILKSNGTMGWEVYKKESKEEV